MMTCQNILEIRNLSLLLSGKKGNDRTERELVCGLDLAVRRGEVTGLIGESGCGKSITCLAVLGLLPPAITRQTGAIFFDKTEISRLPAEKRREYRGRKIAVIMQNPMSCFDAIFTVKEHVLMTIAAQRSKDLFSLGRFQEILEYVGFAEPPEILKSYPFQLSGGMLQRVMVALALLLKAEVLIADEPTTDMDLIVQSRILDLIDNLCVSHGLGILLVTHDLGVVARLADQVAVMRQGRIVETGPAFDIFANPRQDYTKALVKAHFNLHGIVSWPKEGRL